MRNGKKRRPGILGVCALTLAVLLLFSVCGKTPAPPAGETTPAPAPLPADAEHDPVLPDQGGGRVVANLYLGGMPLVPEGWEPVRGEPRFDADAGTLACVLMLSEGDGSARFAYAEIGEHGGLAHIVELPVGEDAEVTLFAVSDQRVYYVEERLDAARQELRLNALDPADGSVVRGTECAALLKRNNAGSVAPSDLAVDADGDVFVLTGREIAVFSPDLALRTSFPKNYVRAELLSDSRGKVLLARARQKDGSYALVPIDKAGAALLEDEAVLIPAAAVESPLYDFFMTPADELIWRTAAGIWVLRGGAAELLMNFENSGCDADSSVLCGAADADTLFIGSTDGPSGKATGLSVWRAARGDALSQIRVIELCSTVRLPAYLTEAVTAFNASHRDVRISVRDYSGENRHADGASRLIGDLESGAYAPDIVLTNHANTDFSYLRDKGLTLDLGQYLAADPIVNRDNVFGCVQHAFATESGGMWAIPDEFELSTVVASPAFRTEGGRTTGELLDFIDSLPPDAVLMEGLTRENAAKRLLGQQGYDVFFDRVNGESSFDDPLYLRWLRFLMRLPSGEEELRARSAFEGLADVDKYRSYREGGVALASLKIKSFNSILYPTFLFGSRGWTFAGYPTADGAVGVSLSGRNVFAVMNRSEEPDEAWEFIASYVSDGDHLHSAHHMRYGMYILKSQLMSDLASADRYVYHFSFSGSSGSASKLLGNSYNVGKADVLLEYEAEDGERLIAFLDEAACSRP
ncbi:MAG: extracellular solute-binding protein [Clostridia bacterium]|nr:extracellular solute-binding protein [Clostridia bacterium]